MQGHCIGGVETRRDWGSWACSAGAQEVKGIQLHLHLPKGVPEALGPDSAQTGAAGAPEAPAQAADPKPDFLLPIHKGHRVLLVISVDRVQATSPVALLSCITGCRDL